MKKVLILLMVVLFCGCTTKNLIITKESLDRELDMIDLDLESKGLQHISSSQAGDEYTFYYKDTLGNTLDYTLFYTLGIEEHEGLYYVTDLEVKSCNSSKPRYCKQIREIEDLTPDATLYTYDPQKTTMLGIASGVGVLVIVALVLLL